MLLGYRIRKLGLVAPALTEVWSGYTNSLAATPFNRLQTLSTNSSIARSQLTILRSFLLIFSQITDKQTSYVMTHQDEHGILHTNFRSQSLRFRSSIHSLFPSRLLTFNWRWNEVADCLIACYTINILTDKQNSSTFRHRRRVYRALLKTSQECLRCVLRCHDNHDPHDG